MRLRAERVLPLKTLKKTIYIFSIIFIFCFIFLKIEFNDVYTKIIQEDNFVENAEVVVYFLSFLFAFTIAINFIKTRHRFCGLFYIILCIMFIFICGEEVSWGQRIFNIEIPMYFEEHNVQKELTLHNLDILHNPIYVLYVLVGFFGAFTWLILPKKVKAKYNLTVTFFVPDRFLIFYFLPTFILYLCYCIYGISILLFGIMPFCIGNNSFIVWRDQEPAELLLAFGFLFFVIINKWKQDLALYKFKQEESY